MKKLILFAAILFTGVSVVNAQEHTGASSSSTSKLVVQLSSIQSIIVQNQDQAVLKFETVEHYADPTTVTSGKIGGHLSIYSTGDFTVFATLASDAEELFKDIEVIVTKDNTNIAKRNLGIAEGDASSLFATGVSGVNQLYDVEYKATNTSFTSSDYMARVRKSDTNVTEIETEVIYSILPR